MATFEELATLVGCIVCRLEGTFTPAELHHPLKGGRRIADDYVVPLCYYHHRSGLNNGDLVSRHPYKARFVERYGSESFLRDEALRLLGEIKSGETL